MYASLSSENLVVRFLGQSILAPYSWKMRAIPPFSPPIIIALKIIDLLFRSGQNRGMLDNKIIQRGGSGFLRANDDKIRQRPQTPKHFSPQRSDCFSRIRPARLGDRGGSRHGQLTKGLAQNFSDIITFFASVSLLSFLCNACSMRSLPLVPLEPWLAASWCESMMPLSMCRQVTNTQNELWQASVGIIDSWILKI